MTDSDSSTSEARETDDEPLNIREDWDSATIYVEPKAKTSRSRSLD